MGADGGSIPKRDDLVSVKKKQPDASVRQAQAAAAAWTTCAVSSTPLRLPLACDALGRLYSREAAVTALLTKSVPSSLSADLSGLRDLISLHPNLAQATNAAAAPRVVCPVTGLEAGGSADNRYAFIALRPCGHVMSQRAVDEVQTASCLVCGQAYDPAADRILLVPMSEEAVAENRRARDAWKNRAKASKRKRSKTAGSSTPVVAREAASATTTPATATTTASTTTATTTATASTTTATTSASAASGTVTTTAAALKPSEADPKVWNSIFSGTNEREKKRSKHGHSAASLFAGAPGSKGSSWLS